MATPRRDQSAANGLPPRAAARVYVPSDRAAPNWSVEHAEWLLSLAVCSRRLADFVSESWPTTASAVPKTGRPSVITLAQIGGYLIRVAQHFAAGDAPRAETPLHAEQCRQGAQQIARRLGFAELPEFLGFDWTGRQRAKKLPGEIDLPKSCLTFAAGDNSALETSKLPALDEGDLNSLAFGADQLAADAALVLSKGGQTHVPIRMPVDDGQIVLTDETVAVMPPANRSAGVAGGRPREYPMVYEAVAEMRAKRPNGSISHVRVRAWVKEKGGKVGIDMPAEEKAFAKLIARAKGAAKQSR